MSTIEPIMNNKTNMVPNMTDVYFTAAVILHHEYKVEANPSKASFRSHGFFSMTGSTVNYETGL